MLKYFLDDKEVDEKIYKANKRPNEKKFTFRPGFPIIELLEEEGNVTGYILDSEEPTKLTLFCPECEISLSMDEVYPDDYDELHCKECGKLVRCLKK